MLEMAHAALASKVGDRSDRSMGRPKARYENHKFVAPKGTRALYKKAAELAGVEMRFWIRETLHREAVRLLREHGVEDEVPHVHPQPPPPLQDREP